MNVIVANKNSSILNSLDIDIIKSLNGEFTIAEIVQIFSNFFFGKIIIDRTAIKDIENQSQVNYLTKNIEPNKIIIYDSTQDEQLTYLLQSSGIYNVAYNKSEIMDLYNNPRTGLTTVNSTYNNTYNLSSLSNDEDTYNNISSYYEEVNNETETIQNKIKVNNLVHKIKLDPKKRIIGFKNATTHAGATSLIYMIIKDLKDINILGIEIKKHDFTFFNNKKMLSTSKEKLADIIDANKDRDYILIDINNENVEDVCDEVIYLIEPSTIKLNKMVMFNNTILKELKDKKIVLSQSLLTNADINVFNKESGLKVLYNLKPLNDKVDNSNILREFMSIITK